MVNRKVGAKEVWGGILANNEQDTLAAHKGALHIRKKCQDTGMQSKSRRGWGRLKLKGQGRAERSIRTASQNFLTDARTFIKTKRLE
jgi:hypothetical protein